MRCVAVSPMKIKAIVFDESGELAFLKGSFKPHVLLISGVDYYW